MVAFPSRPKQENSFGVSITELDRLQEEETLDEEAILTRLEECLGSISKTDSYELKRSYSDLWHRLFTDFNQGKEPDERMVGPVGILEEYCRLKDNHIELVKLASPKEFSDNFVDVSFKLKLDMLGPFYFECQKTLREVSIEVENKNFNKEGIYYKINRTFYEVPQEWLIF